ncbi:uncharacterized protein DUF3179 [Tamilnaduibacter salinus]|uniref:Uncharacterized protein DUF3179 n=1 Tax=Tamilnaduibacter salinus TaxID=1484056 RepID=A0A2U1CXZ0_9GAMM|nr:DUF3179 domain-containing protein [Tamilnaduibacter salinus]PVY77375.1 uncharacterized protein DUF3179 [Tamilnaduibacter salinus]
MIISRVFFCTLVAGLLAYALNAAAISKNGFDLSNATIPAQSILSGGPPRDGIPALTDPAFRPTDDVQPWPDDHLLIRLRVNGTNYGFPRGIMNWHEIVNFTDGGQSILLTYCPLCGTGMAFNRKVDGRTLSFGVSGLLHNSDLLMYDRETESLWSQIPGRAVSGPMAGEALERLPTDYVSWAQWRSRYPDGQVLTRQTGHRRDYSQSPYGNYETSRTVYFPTSAESRQYHPKTWVVGLTHNGESRVWPFPELAEGPKEIRDKVGGMTVRIVFDAETPSAQVIGPDGEPLPATQAYWFAWYAFHPETTIHTHDSGNPE